MLVNNQQLIRAICTSSG